MKKLLYLIPLVLLGLSSCQDVIDIDIPEGQKRVIINGRIADTLPAVVEIYSTVNYLGTDPNPGMTDAVVVLFENNVAVDTMSENIAEPGKYRSAFVGTEGNAYHILVSFPEGHPYFPNTSWTCKPQTMTRVPYADSTYSKFVPREPFVEEGYYGFLEFVEPAGAGDNYRTRLWRNDTLLNTQFDLSFFNDDFIDGFNFTGDFAVQIGGVSVVGDTYKIETSSISAEAYKFLSILQQQTVQVGSTFDPPPAPIYGNIYNANNPNQLGLGFFFVSKLSFADIEIVE